MSKQIPNINSLHKEKNTKEQAKIDVFSLVLNKCIEKITFTNRHTDKTFIIFEVPKILIGYTNYDMNLCIQYLMTKLSRENYKVDFMDPFYLYIDWGSSVCSASNSISSSDKLKEQKKKLLRKYPNSNIIFEYEK